MKCPKCNKDFYEGEIITLNKDEKLIHSKCASEEDKNETFRITKK